ncbi:hypothetical protein MmiEs2_00810 [Methanimicrococcus stummii]|uniref:Uncharacterized protein n=1 Tax=Methanimicrococcus stummii TaxID=3028294 RepID=A0AA96VK87_9EURY|nr:hypothetical protein MmiEs2_00810 [Methanimicrococcus sp. Es2]
MGEFYKFLKKLCRSRAPRHFAGDKEGVPKAPLRTETDTNRKRKTDTNRKKEIEDKASILNYMDSGASIPRQESAFAIAALAAKTKANLAFFNSRSSTFKTGA